ncbi:hypothetical protein Tco_1011393, partial [Tanacetum coccineum]
MADDVPAPALIRSNEQILPFVAWVPIGKCNYDANLLREALEITPIDQAHHFVSPSSGDAIMDFVNELRYTEEIHFVSRMAVNNLYQPWRAILSMINQCLTGKTSGYDRPRYPVLQMLCGIITSTNVDHTKLMWEEFMQAIQTFLTDKANLGSPTKKGRKDKPHVIPYCRFTKLIICYLGRTHNIHKRSESPFHLANEDIRLGNLKFVSKGEKDKHDQNIAAEKEGKKKLATVKQPKPKPAKERSSKPAPAPKSTVTKEKTSKPSLEKQPKRGKMSLEVFQVQIQAHVGSVAIREPVAEATRSPPVVEGKGKAIVTDEQAAQSLLALHTPKRRSTTDQFIFQRQTPATKEAPTGSSVQILTNSRGDTKILQIGDEQGEEVANVVNLDEKTAKIDEGQTGSDPVKTPESRPPPEHIFMDEDQARPDPGSLKFPANEYVILEEPLSSSGTLSSMKNLDDAYTIGDQFLNEKSTEDELGKLNVDSEVVSMVTDLPYKNDEAVHKAVREAVKVVLEILHQRMFESGTYKSLPKHVALYEALKTSMERENRDEFLAKKDKSSKRCHDDQYSPLPPPDLDPRKKKIYDFGASGSSQPLAPQSSTWKTSDTKDKSSGSSVYHLSPPEDQQMNDDPVPADEEHTSGDEDLGIDLKVPSCEDWWKPRDDDERPATPWVIHTSHIPDAMNNWANALDTTKGSRPALSISKMKAAHYPDFGLELLVPEHMWINDVCTYEISASYGISHWWFNRQKFYIDRHTADSRRKVFRTHMRILSVVRIKAYSRYGYDYLKEMVLRRADYQEYTIAKKDFKNLYPSDFKDPNLLLLQGHLNYLPGSDKRMLSTVVKLWTRNL